jgi:DNA-binding XRE family transcriptional regulator
MREVNLLRCVGRNIQAARRSVGLTQECLAELVGVHWQTISGIERGRYPCSLATFARISQHLKISADKLLEGIDSPNAKESGAIRKALARRRVPKSGADS